jgi:spoIIIJ-associated protein
MNPYERRIVHSTVQTVNGATSKSIGSEPNRKVVISPIEGAKPRGERKFRDGKGDRRQGRGNRAPRESQKVIVAPNEQPKNDVSSLSLYGRIDLD